MAWIKKVSLFQKRYLVGREYPRFTEMLGYLTFSFDTEDLRTSSNRIALNLYHVSTVILQKFRIVMIV